MPQGTAEDRNDVLIEHLNTALFLALGILAMAVSIILLGYSVAAIVYSKQLSSSLLATSVFASSLLLVSLGAVQIFRKRRQLRKRKESLTFYRAPV